jgi:predicted DNA-binding transcriptional regulator AlpA
MVGKNQNNLIDITCCWNCTNRRLLTLEEAAEACGASINTIYQRMKRGEIE